MILKFMKQIKKPVDFDFSKSTVPLPRNRSDGIRTLRRNPAGGRNKGKMKGSK